MKKIISVVLALAMVLSFAGIASAADETCRLSVVLAEDSKPVELGNVVTFDFVVDNITTNNFQTGKVKFAYDHNVLVPCYPDGSAFEAGFEDELITVPNRWSVIVDSDLADNAATDKWGFSVYSTNKNYANDGLTLEAGAAFKMGTMSFKVVGEGNAEIKLLSLEEDTFGVKVNSIVNGEKVSLKATLVNYPATAPVEDKVVTGLATAVAVEGVENLPKTVDVTVEGETEALKDVAVAWDTTGVGTEAKDYTVPGTLTLPEGYVLKDGTAITATVTVKSVEPADKVVTGLAAAVAVEGVENLPATVDVAVEGETEALNVAVVWDTTNVGTEAGDYTVTGTLTLPEGYVLKADAAITATVTVKPVEVITVTATTEGDHAVNATITLDSTGKYTINAVANTAYAGDNKLDGSNLYLVLTGYKVEGDNRVPYFVDIIPIVSLEALNDGGVRTLDGAYSNVNAISYSIIQGLDINNITGEGLGTAVTYVPMVSLAK